MDSGHQLKSNWEEKKGSMVGGEVKRSPFLNQQIQVQILIQPLIYTEQVKWPVFLFSVANIYLILYTANALSTLQFLRYFSQPQTIEVCSAIIPTLQMEKQRRQEVVYFEGGNVMIQIPAVSLAPVSELWSSTLPHL